MRARVPRSGVTVGNPEFEWRSAAKDYHYTFEAFMALSLDEQTAILAHRRVSSQIEAVLSFDATEKARKAQKKR